jgi:uncharacterized lipoprotein YmbA
MKPFLTRGVPAVSAALLLLLLAGCGGHEEYFRLSADGPAVLPSTGMSLVCGPVALPTYVDRAELVFQTSDNEFQVPANVHWTGTLLENFTHVLATDLGRRLHSGNVLVYPAPPTLHPRYQVAVDVRQFHAISGGDAILDVDWRVQVPATGEILRRRNGSFHERISGDGYAPVVSAESRLVAQLADAIAQSLK